MMTSSPGLEMLEKKFRLPFSFILKKKLSLCDAQNGKYDLLKTGDWRPFFYRLLVIDR